MTHQQSMQEHPQMNFLLLCLFLQLSITIDVICLPNLVNASWLWFTHKERDIIFDWKQLYGSNIIVVIIPLSCDSGSLLQ